MHGKFRPRTFEFENHPAVKKMMEDREKVALEDAAETDGYEDGSDDDVLGRVMGDDENDFDDDEQMEEEEGRDEL